MSSHPAGHARSTVVDAAGQSAAFEALQHDHVFLGARHAANERRTWTVIWLCTITMLVEIGGGIAFRSMALLADGIHMATHAGAMLIAAAAYFYARRHLNDPRFSFGTGKVGDLAAFVSGVVLAGTSILIAIESVERLLAPQVIAFDEALPIAVIGLAVNLVSAWLLRDDHQHHHHGDDHSAAHPHDDGHHHEDDAHDDHQHHHDHNLRAAYVHVVSDAVVSMLAIVGLLAGRQLGWVWMDPLMGIVGALVIARWSIGLMRTTGAVLLDMSPGQALAARIRRRIEVDGDRIADLHVWRIGPGHNAASLVVLSQRALAPSAYRDLLAGIDTLSHITIEVEPARQDL
jgi:cation diffusion facilitator family transporter